MSVGIQLRARGTGRLASGIGIFAVAAAVFFAAPAPHDLRAHEGAQDDANQLDGFSVLLESDGLPGRTRIDETEAERHSRQRLLVTKDRLRLEDSKTGSTFLLRLDEDPPKIWELSADLGQYFEVKKGEEIQQARRRWERQEVAKYRKVLSKEEFQKFLAEEHLREDGKHIVEVASENVGKMLDYPVKRYRVRENGRLIVDVKVTDALKTTIPFFDFYRRLGAFSDEVLTALQAIPGVPLEATIVVVTDTFHYEIHTLVKDIQKERLSAQYFEIPPGAEEVDEARQVVQCTRHGCENRVEVDAPGGKYTFNLTTYYFCSMKCRKEWRQKELKPIIEKRARQKGPGTAAKTGSKNP